jgi:hypothetical protein
MSLRKRLQSLVSPTALVAAGALLVAPLAASSRPRADSIPPPVDDSARPSPGEPAGSTPEAPRPGMSTGKKVVILAGAAALYYLYKHHQQSAASGQGAEGQYYLSKNGRVYYRDAQHRAHWVTPPAEGIRVPEKEAAEYSRFQGYDGRTDGRDLAGLNDDAQ